MAENPSLAVHLHLYAPEMWKEIRKYLENIQDYPYHLFVTLTQDSPDIAQTITDFHPETTFFLVENKGYDVGPFIHFLHQIDLKQYDLILKIHTKSLTEAPLVFINNRPLNRKFWFRLLFEGVLGSEKLFQKNISAFKQDEKLGIIGSKYLITSRLKHSPEVIKDVNNVMKQMGFTPPPKITFVCGTMFMIRSHLLFSFKENFTLNDFKVSDKTDRSTTLAHILERAFGCAAIAQGYKIKGFDTDYSYLLYSLITSVKTFIYRKKITSKNKLQIKIFKIPVFSRKIT